MIRDHCLKEDKNIEFWSSLLSSAYSNIVVMKRKIGNLAMG